MPHLIQFDPLFNAFIPWADLSINDTITVYDQATDFQFENFSRIEAEGMSFWSNVFAAGVRGKLAFPVDDTGQADPPFTSLNYSFRYEVDSSVITNMHGLVDTFLHSSVSLGGNIQQGQTMQADQREWFRSGIFTWVHSPEIDDPSPDATVDDPQWFITFPQQATGGPSDPRASVFPLVHYQPIDKALGVGSWGERQSVYHDVKGQRDQSYQVCDLNLIKGAAPSPTDVTDRGITCTWATYCFDGFKGSVVVRPCVFSF